MKRTSSLIYIKNGNGIRLTISVQLENLEHSLHYFYT